MSDFTPNVLTFDSAGAMNLIRQVIDWHLDELSGFLQNIVRAAIVALGNGSKVMRLFTAGVVEETKREITNSQVVLEVGIKMENLPEDGFVRVSVVLEGNQGSGPLVTKPGNVTWRKHVVGRGESTAKTSYPLPAGFNQGSKMDNVLNMIFQNVQNDATKHVNDFIRNINSDVSRLDFSQFLKGG